MYDKFTDRARKVMQLANQEAQRLNHEYIATEHILVGIAKEGGGIAYNILRNLDINLQELMKRVRDLVMPGPRMVTMGKLPQTPRAKKVVDLAVSAAFGEGCSYVGSEHLLLGLVREGEGVAARVLGDLGVTDMRVAEEMGRLMRGTANAGIPPIGAPWPLVEIPCTPGTRSWYLFSSAINTRLTADQMRRIQAIVDESQPVAEQDKPTEASAEPLKCWGPDATDWSERIDMDAIRRLAESYIAIYRERHTAKNRYTLEQKSPMLRFWFRGVSFAVGSTYELDDAELGEQLYRCLGCDRTERALPSKSPHCVNCPCSNGLMATEEQWEDMKARGALPRTWKAVLSEQCAEEKRGESESWRDRPPLL